MLFSLYNDKNELVTVKGGHDLVHNCSNMLKRDFCISYPYGHSKDNDDDWDERLRDDMSVEDVIVLLHALMNSVSEKMLSNKDYETYHMIMDAKKFLYKLIKLRIAEDLKKREEEKNESKGDEHKSDRWGKVIFRVNDADDEGLMKIVYDFVCKMSDEWRKTRFLFGNDGVEYRLTEKGEIEVEYEDCSFFGSDAEFTWETRIEETEDVLTAFDVEYEKEEIGPYFKEEEPKSTERECVRINLRGDVDEDSPKHGENKRCGAKDITEERSYIEVGCDESNKSKDEEFKEIIEEVIEIKEKQESLKFIYKIEDFMDVDSDILKKICRHISYMNNGEEMRYFDNGIVDYVLREEEGEIEVGYLFFDKKKQDSEIMKVFYTMCDMIETCLDEYGVKYRRILGL